MVQDDELDLSIFGRRIVDHLRLIFVLAILGAISMVVYTLFATPVYRAKASLLLVQSGSSAPSAAAQAAMALGGAGSGQAQQAGMLQGILASENALGLIATQAGIERDDLEKDLVVNFDAKQSVLSFSYDSAKPEIGVKVLRATIESLNQLNRDIGFSVAARQANLLKTSVSTAEKELKMSEEQLKEFAKKAETGSDAKDPSSSGFYLKQLRQAEFELGTIETSLAKAKSVAMKSSALNLVPSGVIAIKPWQDKLAELQYQLQVAQQKYGPEAPEIVALQKTISVTKSQLNSETQKYISSVNEQIEPNLAQLEAKRLTADYQVKYWRRLAESAPDEALGLSRLGRQVALKSTTLAQLQEQYNRAKIESEVDRVRWSELDKPYFMKAPINKSKGKPAILGFILGGFLGCLFALSRKS